MKTANIRFRYRALARLSMLALVAVAAAALPPPAAARSPQSPLARYVTAPDASYAWRELRSRRFGTTEVTEIILTSHTWRGVPWKHQLIVIRPANLDPAARQAFLYIHGGRWKPEYENGAEGPLPKEARIFTRLAESLRAPVAVLRQVPFQPLFERREDALIAYTFDRYLRSGEEDWPLLLPMVKSATRGMDTIQEFAAQRWQLPIERFTVTGASKRGWTSWLTAAVDARVASVAPMVIDMLNLPAQIELQRATFGELSEQVSDYRDIDLAERIGTDLGRKLLAMVDPYSYRQQIVQPKLILLATNDRYWPLDALRLYWGGLVEPKSVRYVPNQGHGIRDVKSIVASLSALHRYSARGEQLPALSWSFASDARRVSATVRADRRPQRVVAWTATSATRDFRDARWSSRRCERRGAEYRCTADLRAGRLTGFFAEAWFHDRGAPAFPLTTPVCIAGVAGGEGKGC